MIARRPPSFFADLLRRLTAGGSAALMLLLVMLAASPSLHERFHGANSLEKDEGCAVALFANGVSLATGAIAVPSPQLAWAEAPCPFVAEIFLVSPQYLRQPERGPPLS